MTEQEMQELLNKNENNNKHAQQKQTERRKANEIHREINTLNEKLISLRKQYTDHKSRMLKREIWLGAPITDEHTKQEFSQQMTQIYKQIDALKTILDARKFRSPAQKSGWFSLSNTSQCILPNENDEYRTGLEGGSIRVIHRNDAGKIAAISMKDISRDPATSIKQIRDNKEDWDEYLKDHDKTKPLYIKSPSPAMNDYLWVYAAARHGQSPTVNSVCDSLSKNAPEQKEQALFGAATCYTELYNDIMKSSALSEEDKSTFKAEIDAELGLEGRDFSQFLSGCMNSEQKHNKLANPSTGTSIKRFFGQDEEFKQLVQEQNDLADKLKSPQLAQIFSKYFSKLDNGVSATFNTVIHQNSTATLRAF